jgi:long-subunit fatty acid transport protein
MSGILGNFDASLTPAYGFNPDFNNITGFSADIYFKGTSVFFGYQLGLTYQINDVFSVYAGGRFVTAKNTYEGHIRDVQVDAAPNQAGVPTLYNTPVGSYTPGDYFNAVSQATGLAGTSNELLLQGIGAALQTAAADQEVDAEETGNGFAPILGLNISPNDKLNIGLKYEFKTKMDLTTTVNDDKGAGLFMQDSTVHSDMPAMASVGVSYKILPDLRASAGFHYYWDKGANYGKTLDAGGEQVGNDEVMDNNFFEVSLGLEYDITAKLLVSGGWLNANTGVTDDYQSDLSYSLTSNTFGVGVGYKFTEKLMVNLGGAFVMYQEGEKSAVDMSSGQPYTDTYYKDAVFFGIGVDVSF